MTRRSTTSFRPARGTVALRPDPAQIQQTIARKRPRSSARQWRRAAIPPSLATDRQVARLSCRSRPSSRKRLPSPTAAAPTPFSTRSRGQEGRASRSGQAVDRQAQDAERRSRAGDEPEEFDAIYSTPEGKAMIDGF
jgi:hypothetical protein